MSLELTAGSSTPAEDDIGRGLDLSTPVDYRPDLSALGIHEIERGVCEDNYENRRTLRDADLQYNWVYDLNGKPTGLIAARSPDAVAERRLLSLREKRPVLTIPDDHNSDYLTGVDLLLSDEAPLIVPPWVIGATKKWQAQQVEGIKPGRTLKPMPVRCRIIKSDGIRCMLWGSGRVDDDGLCRIHLKSLIGATGEDIERARRKLTQSAPHAVDVLEELMQTAESEPVRLKASTEILDRAGIRGGQDLTVDMSVHETLDPREEVLRRLERLRLGAEAKAAREERAELDADAEIVDAEIVGDVLPDLDGEKTDAPPAEDGLLPGAAPADGLPG